MARTGPLRRAAKIQTSRQEMLTGEPGRFRSRQDIDDTRTSLLGVRRVRRMTGQVGGRCLQSAGWGPRRARPTLGGGGYGSSTVSIDFMRA